MKILAIITHPRLEQSRVNRCWLRALEASGAVTVDNLYQRYPDELINVEAEQDLLLQHDRLVFQFPVYWYRAPYLLLKWFEQVFSYGWAYGPGGRRLQGKELVLAASFGGPAESYQAGGYNNYSASELFKPFQATANLVGARYLAPFLLFGAVAATDERIEQSAQAYLRHITDPELDPQVALSRLLSEMEHSGKSL